MKPCIKPWSQLTQDEKFEALCDLIKQLQETLIEFGGHQPGCLYPYGIEYGCKCGWLAIEATLKSTERSKT